ncbi:MAG: DUF2332 family protein [Paracoccaceae bacterium]
MSDISAIFDRQGQACVALGSPFMGRLMTLCATRLRPGTRVTDLLFNWPGDPAPNADNAPLRLAGGLHALRLNDLALTSVYPPHDVSDEKLWDAISETLNTHEAHILAWLAQPPQTNEVRRIAGILPALAVVASRDPRPIDLLELGCSGGLNLHADHFRLILPEGSIGRDGAGVQHTPEWKGEMPPRLLPTVKRRAGVDLNPLDPRHENDRTRLLAYVWADQRDRIARTQATMKIATNNPAEIDAGDAGHWLETQLARPSEGRLRVVMHTVAWQYFSPETAQRAQAALRASNNVVRLSMEADGGKGAALTLTNYPDEVTETLGRIDFHGRWVDWVHTS